MARFLRVGPHIDFGGAQTVEDHWQGKNVDLSLLSEKVTQFFSEKQFAITTGRNREGCVVTALPKSFHGISEEISVHVLGRSDDFSVKFIAGSHSNNLVRYGTLLSLIGGGFLVSKGLKSLEEIEKLEKKFWVYLDETIWQLEGSSGGSLSPCTKP
jgi:hypothetical protein